jgi:hypothetical protein
MLLFQGVDAEAAERALQEEKAEAAPEEFAEEAAGSAAEQSLDARIERALDPLQRLGFRMVAQMDTETVGHLDSGKKKNKKSAALTYDATSSRTPSSSNVYKPH